MNIARLFREYCWIIDTIRRAGKITLAEINKKWGERIESEGNEIPRTTFNRHRAAILEMFGIIIECDRRNDYTYYIENAEELKENTIQNWLWSTLSVRNMIEDNVAVRGRILIESIPSGDETLRTVIEAMKEGRQLMIGYKRYGAVMGNRVAVQPYCVKVFNRRWYMLGRIERVREVNGKRRTEGVLTVFAIDRIESIRMMETRFEVDKKFDAEEYFGECYGIVVGDGTEAERIVIRAYGKEAHYMRDVPIHRSQKEIAETEEYTDYEMRVRPTSDLVSYIMSRGENIKVIEPESLAEKVRERLRAAMEVYENN
ncbi:MAG: WYL domain-containing protein [Bacteroidales bacterium]|nr:WYL domain-containing protein [Bacteroidales bacterium]